MLVWEDIIDNGRLTKLQNDSEKDLMKIANFRLLWLTWETILAPGDRWLS